MGKTAINLEKIFKDFLIRENLEKEKIIFSVSGGVDSRVLLEVAYKTLPRENIAVFHLDHRARKESDSDAKFVEEVCKKKNIKYFGYRLSHTPSKNKEAFWRKERKKYAERAKKIFFAERVLTAHHATDLVETIIFRLVKGAGIEGFFPFDISTKPFWNVPKKEIEQYAKEKKILFVKDATNDSTQYERNLIRNKVLPELRKITPNLEKVFVRESEIFRNIKKYIEKNIPSEEKISIKEFKNKQRAEQAIILRNIAQDVVSASDLNDCLRWILENKRGGTQKKLGKTILKKKRGVFFAEKKS